MGDVRKRRTSGLSAATKTNDGKKMPMVAKTLPTFRKSQKMPATVRGSATLRRVRCWETSDDHSDVSGRTTKAKDAETKEDGGDIAKRRRHAFTSRK